MYKMDRFFFTIIYSLLLFNGTKQSAVKQAVMAFKAIGKTIKSPLLKTISNTIKKPIAKTFANTVKKSVGMFSRNKSTIQNLAFGLQGKYLKTSHNFGSKHIKYLGAKAIKNLKYSTPLTVRVGNKIVGAPGKENMQLSAKKFRPMIERSAAWMKGNELRSLVNMVSKSKLQLPFLFAAGGLGRLTQMNVLEHDAYNETTEKDLLEPMQNMPKELKVEKIREVAKTVFETSQIPGLTGLIEIPNLSRIYDPDFHSNGKIQKAIDYCIDWAYKQGIVGLTMKSVKSPSAGTPMLFGIIEPTKVKFKNVVMYGHLDKVPHNKDDWSEGLHPTKPVIEDGHLYGRGSTDNGYSFFTAVAAAKISQQSGVAHDRIVLFFETDEESGSKDVDYYLDHFKGEIGQPDLFLCLDSAGPDYDRFASTISLRGNISGELKVSVLKQSLHSGHVGGVVPDSFMVIRSLQSRLEDEETGEVIEELNSPVPSDKFELAQKHDAMLQQREEDIPTVEGLESLGGDSFGDYINKTWGASLTVTGMEGFPAIEDASNVVRPYTKLKFSVRTSPDLDVYEGRELIRKLQTENPPYGAHVDLEMDEPGQGFSAPKFESAMLEKMKDTSKVFWDNEMALFGVGGSIPVVGKIQQRFPKTAIYVGGVGGPGDNSHGPDENINLAFWEKYTSAITYFLSEL